MKKKDEFLMGEILVNINYEPMRVLVADYVKAKTKDLIAFGYSTLTEEQVLSSVKRVINKEKLSDVIDHFVKGDICEDQN